MAQVKLIETEEPQHFRPVTIQVTFETQEELNAMEAITGWLSYSFDAVKNCNGVRKTNLKSWDNVARSIYRKIEKLAK